MYVDCLISIARDLPCSLKLSDRRSSSREHISSAKKSFVQFQLSPGGTQSDVDDDVDSAGVAVEETRDDLVLTADEVIDY